MKSLVQSIFLQNSIIALEILYSFMKFSWWHWKATHKLRANIKEHYLLPALVISLGIVSLLKLPHGNNNGLLLGLMAK